MTNSIFDVDALVEEYLLMRLMSNADLVGLIGANTETGLPQIYPDNAPERGRPAGSNGNPPPPFVIYYPSSGMVPNRPLGNAVAWYEGVWGVKAAGRGDDKDLVRRVHRLIVASLDNTDGQVSEGRVVVCQEEATQPQRPEIVDGVVYIERGSTFRLQVQPLESL